jgi:hypothetical protein
MLALLILLQETTTDFNDIGKLMLGGLAAAIILAVAFTFFRLKVQEKRPRRTSFIGINSTEGEQRD